MLLFENEEYIGQLKRLIEESDVDWKRLDGCSVMVSGAAGLIASAAVDALIYCNEYKNMRIDIVAIGRTRKKLEARYGKYADKPYFHLVTADVTEEFDFDYKADYIIHAASNANPYLFANYPVDTLLANIIGMDRFLAYARDHESKRVLYVSSGEMYGQPDESQKNGFCEPYCGKVDYSDPRSCYPSGKRAAEVLCQSYIRQFGVDSVIVRPCHCYGPTQTRSDNRATTQFIWNASDGEDIVLKSEGLLERTHCYVLDAVSAMFFVLLDAPGGEAYNIADNDSDASIRSLAKTIAKAGGVNVVFDIPDEADTKGYSKVTRAVLNGEKIRGIGWKALWNLETGAESTIRILRSIRE